MKLIAPVKLQPNNEQLEALKHTHVISKRIVERVQDTGRGIAMENLQGIHNRITVRKAQRRQHHSWGFNDLQQKIEYKAKLVGVPVVFVDPRNTSRTCPLCNCIDKRNRPNQETFLCVSCGYSANADTNAAENIRRAAVSQPNVSDAVQTTVAPGTSPLALAVGR